MAIQALVMGFGGTGAHVLTALKELTVLKQGKDQQLSASLFQFSVNGLRSDMFHTHILQRHI